MEIIKRKILREDIVTRKSGVGYGRVSEKFIYMNIHLTQTVDNMGIFSDFPTIEAPQSFVDKKAILEGYRPRFKKKSWYKVGDKTEVETDSKLSNMKGYKEDERYKVGFDNNKETYIDFSLHEIKGVSRIISKDEDSTTYVIDAKNDGFIGSDAQTTGLRYIDLPDGTTIVDYIPQGVNDTNSSVMANSKEEYLLGIISKPEIKNDVFIERGELSVTEPHLRLSEIETLEHLTNYGNGYFNVVK